MRSRGRVLLAAVAIAAATRAGPPLVAQAPQARPLKVVAFSGVPTIPIRVAEARGLFARRGLKVETEITPNSPVLRDGLAAGKYDIAHAAVDNAIAMVETAGADVIIVMGGDNSMNELIVQPDVRSVDDLKGRIVAVDAPNTAYALQLRKILRGAGLRESDYEMATVGGTPQRMKAMLADRKYAASMLNPPFSIQAMRGGLRSLGTAARLLGPYQGMGAFVRRDWARANRQALVDYLAAFLEAQRWFLAPENEADAIDLLAKALQLEREVAAQTFERGRAALAPDARMDLDGLRSVLKLRAEIEGQWGGRAPDPGKYYDATYHDAALAALKTGR
ncbi:MAG TPA: ABC transporter substrate-binding protein [Vicinamibacterales bacterium]|nr:ABC transporter substrate-binding protein [Vicinamibacterales bacterium]